MAIPHAPEPENTIVFETDSAARKDPRSLSARAYLVFVARHCPNGVEEAVVKKIEYRKSSEAPNHEFLLCFVEDHNVPTRQAIIRIECFNQNQIAPDRGVPFALPPAKFLSLDALRSSSPSLFSTTVDVFTITCGINDKRSDTTLSTLIFDDNSGFSADETAMICQIVSECADEYNSVGHQCYWYAGVVYDVIQETQSGRFTKTPAEDNKHVGKGWGMRSVNNQRMNIFSPPEHASEQLSQTHLRKWPEWVADIEAKKKKRSDEQQELDRKDEEIAKLQKKLNEYKRRV
ncbi:hypothetical protein ARMSODRAFT_1024488 [Armillaria solidipes]|uniref:Uncharacterized protein n=1 Tax=Armillaria solidipes TaxID=1076256 RepID=A0A2H3AW32_9AGAR|nr:hypothetical protein ARMSODRAFT_1024488 [Armillaria solidipes]